MKKIFFIFTLLAVLLVPIGVFSQSSNPGDFGAIRVEDDFSLAYPEGKSEEILEYLKKTYIDDKNFVNKLGAGFTVSFGDEDFTDTYFDTPTLQLSKRKTGLRYRFRVNRLDPSNRKSGRELIQLKISGDDKLDDTAQSGSRNELKFDVQHPVKIQSADDAHPLIGLVIPEQREEFKTRVKEILGIDPYGLKPILTIEQRRRRVYVNRGEETLVSFSVDDAKSRRWWAKAKFSQMELELNELTYTNADDLERKRLRQIRETMVKDLRQEFEYLEDDTYIKYTKMLDSLAKKIPFMRFWIRIGLM